MQWDPAQYGKYSDERSRPFIDLIARIGASAPRHVVDIGCGAGTLTALLKQRWPDALVEGIDSSPEMIDAAAPVDGVAFSVQDAATWQPAGDVDVIVSNAALQWVPGHEALVAAWAAAVPRSGWLAFQVPGNFGSPSHALMRELSELPRWSSALAGVLRHHDAVASPQRYAQLLANAGLAVDVWETTYLHILPGADPVLDWLRGTGLRPVLAALPADEGAAFSALLAERLRLAYPSGAHGTPFPFRRIFAVGVR